MEIPKSLTSLAELLHRAMKAQAHYAQDHPQTIQSMDATMEHLCGLLKQSSPLIITSSKGRLWFQGRPIVGAPNATQALSSEMEARDIAGVAFYDGLDHDELQLFFFALQLTPARLHEMGGPKSLLPEGSSIQVLESEPAQSIPIERSNNDAELLSLDDEDFTKKALPGAPYPAIELNLSALPEPLAEEDALPELPPSSIERAASSAAASLVDRLEEILPSADAAPSPAALTLDLRTLFTAVVQMTAKPPEPSIHMPWSAEQREMFESVGLLVPDFSSLVGTGAQLSLGRMDPTTLRATLRTALSILEPLTQGSVLLGLPTFPAEEQALRRALDYLAPEFLAQAVADVHLKRNPGRFELALLVAGLLQCVKDRELALEAIRGRLQFEGWSLEDLDSLKDAILWECHGTDTKLRLSIMDRGIFELDAHQVMILNRQLVHGKRTEGIRDLLAQLETGFASPEINRRRHAAEIVADLAECLEEPGLPADIEQSLLTTLHNHIGTENDQQALLWSCQAMEALLGYWIRKQNFDGVYKEMLSLAEYVLAGARTPGWKAQAVRDLLGRLASPLNMASMTALLHQRDPEIPTSQIYALLALMGRPAAQYLVSCLEVEEDRNRRSHLLSAIRAIGRNAVPSLREALASDKWFMVRNAVVLLGEIDHKAAFEDVALTLGHRDVRVRRAAIQAVSLLGDPDEAAAVLVEHLPSMEASNQLDALAAMGELKSTRAVPAVAELLQNPKGSTDEAARIRLRAVEILGLIGSPEAVDPLQDLFRKKGFLGGRESTPMRLAAAKSLAAINTRESREALALVMDQESQEDVRSVIRQYLVGDRS
ncbi:MAG TPA: HEAT repeat domain-containing protein [Holophaga sp.]|nr:HEAT repeat domain-containing protein [Holophaga sp.]